MVRSSETDHALVKFRRSEGRMDTIPMTAAGYAVLEEELKHRQKIERPRIIQQITDARTPGDVSANAEYPAAKESQPTNEGPIGAIAERLARAAVTEASKLPRASNKL